MKKNLLTLMLAIGTITTSFGQAKSSGTVQLNGTTFTLKIDVDNVTNLVTFTMAGPLNQWFAIGLDADMMAMGTSKDCITYGTQLLDRHFTMADIEPTTDTTNDLTLVSSTTSGSNRTVKFTRPSSTGDANDYTFNYASLSSLNIIWSIGPTTDVSQEHDIHGSTTLSFATLGNEEFISPLEKTAVYPNPSNGIFKIAKSGNAEISKIKVFDINAKLLKEIKSDLNSSDIQIDMSGANKGIYFLELSNGIDKAVKKIQVN